MASDDSRNHTVSKVYLSWVNSCIHDSSSKISDLKESLKDGCVFCQLIEKTTGCESLFSSKEGPTCSTSDVRDYSIDQAINFMQERGIEITESDTCIKDIASGDLKAILDTLWLIILNFDIHSHSRAAYQRSVSMGKRFLLEWFARELPDVSLEHKGNFVECFQNGILLSRIISKYCSVSNNEDTSSQLKAPDDNILKGLLEAADSQLGIPSCILSPSRLLNGTIDEYTLLIYLAILRRKVCEKKGEDCYKGGGSPIKQRTPQTTPAKSSLIVLKTPPRPVNGPQESPLSPTTLKNLVEQQTKSHEAIQALQAKLQAINYQPLTPKPNKHPLPRTGTQEMPPVYGLSCQSEVQSSNDTSRTDCNENELNSSVVNGGKTGDLKSVYSTVDKHILESMLDAVEGYMLQSGPQEKAWLNGEEAKTLLPKEKQATNTLPQDSPKTENSPEASMLATVDSNSPDVASVETQETKDKYKASQSMENSHEVDVINSEVVDAKPSHAVESLNIPTEKELQQESVKEEGNDLTPKPVNQASFTGRDTVFSPPKASSSPTDSSRNESTNTTEISEDAKNDMGNSLDLNDITKAGLDYPPVASKETVTWASCGAESGEVLANEASESFGSISFDDENDQFMMYLNSIEQTALKFKLQVEQAKIDTLQILKKRLEQAYEGTPLEEIPAKVHEKLQETIAQIATEEVKKYESVLHVDENEFEDDECGILKQMKAELDSLSAENFRLSQELEACKLYEQEYHALQGKIEGMENGLTIMKHDYATKNGESEFLGKRIEALEQEMVSMRVEYEEQIRELQNENIELQKECLELDDENRTLEDELKKIQVGLHEKTYEADVYESQLDDNLAEKITAAELEVLEMRINELERHNKGLKASSEADHAVVVCLEKKVEDLESSLSEAKSANSDLLTELHESQRQQASDRAKLTIYREELEALKRENKVLKCSLESSENEVQYQKRKNEQVRTPTLTSTSTRPHRSPGSLGNKREIWNEIRELETILKDVQKEKQTIERKYQAFRRDSVESNNTANSVNSSTLETTQTSDPGSTSSTLRGTPATTPRSSRKTSSLLDRVNNLLDKSSLPNGARTDVLTSTPVSRVSATLSRDAGNTPRSEVTSRTSMSLGRSPLNSRLSEELSSLRKHVGSLEAEKASILRELHIIRTPTKEEDSQIQA